MGIAVTLSNVTISYARHPAVHHISGCFEAGTLTALAGPNGAGKSTLIKAIAGVIPVDEGHIRIEGGESTPIAYLSQMNDFERDFPMTVLELACTGAWQKAGGFAAITPALQAIAMEALYEVGMHHLAKRNLGTLSAGQFQRVLFARLMVQDAPLILLDEPFNALDAATTEHLLGLIAKWHAQGRTIICVLHDIAVIRSRFPHCLLLARECLGWGNTADVMRGIENRDIRFLPEPHVNAPAICEQPS